MDTFKKIQQEGGDTDERNPRLAGTFMLIRSVGTGINWFVLKYIYILRPEMEGIQILFFGRIIATIVSYLYVNKDVKMVVYDSVPSDNVWMLVARCFMSLLNMGLRYTIFKYFKLTTMTLTNNLSPVFTCIFAVVFLGESMVLGDIIQIIICFVAATLITLGMFEDKNQLQSLKINETKQMFENPHEYAKRDHFHWLYFAFLMMIPFSIASQKVLLRSMRKLHENTISCIVNPFIVVACFVIMKIKGLDTYKFIIDIIKNDWKTLLIFIYLGSVALLQQTLAFKANKLEEASKLAVYDYL